MSESKTICEKCEAIAAKGPDVNPMLREANCPPRIARCPSCGQRWELISHSGGFTNNYRRSSADKGERWAEAELIAKERDSLLAIF